MSHAVFETYLYLVGAPYFDFLNLATLPINPFAVCRPQLYRI